MTTDPIDACAAAIAGVGERYEILDIPGGDGACYVWDKQEQRRLHLTFQSEAECQAWIDREAARACLGATLPVSEETITTICTGVYGMGCFQDPRTRDEVRRISTAAIHAITKQENV